MTASRHGHTDASTGPGAVLVVDDDEGWAWATSQLLQQETGFAVETATDLRTARERFADLDPDCVVCDYDLGSGDGLSLLESIRKIDSSLPFLLVTGKGDETVASSAIRRGVTDYIRKGRDNENELLVRRVRALVRSYRSERAIERQRQMKTAVLDILRETASVSAFCREFCRRLIDTRPYALAWIGASPENGYPQPKASAGHVGYLDALIDGDGLPDSEPAFRAAEQNEPVVARVDPEDGDEGWRALAAECGFRSVVAVPIQYEAVTFGVLAVYLIEPTTGATEREEVEEFAESIAYALSSIDQKRSLLHSQPVLVDVTIHDRDIPLVGVADHISGTPTIRSPSVIVRDDGTSVYRCQIEGPPIEAVESAVGAVNGVSIQASTEDADGLECSIVATGTTPEEVLIDSGVRFERTIVDNGVTTISVYLREDQDVAQFSRTVERAFGDATVSTVWSEAEPEDFSDDPFDALTDKQREILRHAFHEGYFERPRNANATEIAARLGICRQTFTQHLRAAERKILATWATSERDQTDGRS